MIGGDCMLIKQSKFFEGLDFEKCEFEYPFGRKACYKGADGGYYRIDHFGASYVIEYAENEEEAKNNQFEDTDVYNDSLPTDKIINMIQADLQKYTSA